MRRVSRAKETAITTNMSERQSSLTTSEKATPAPGSKWPDLAEGHPLSKLLATLPNILKQADYAEVYGIHLRDSSDFLTKLILQKFLRANANDITKAEAQLLDTLKWRKSFQPLKAKDEVFSKKRFDGLGYVMTLTGVPASMNAKDIVTFNIYGKVKDSKATFSDLEGFMRWRVGLMELSMEQLELQKATTPIPDFGEGPDIYQGIQVHDYLSVSFLRRDPDSKAAASRAIETFQRYYPETLSRKFFVNVPVIMGWMFSTMKMVLSKETVKKFTVFSYGEYLATELGQGVPKVYGGKAGDLESSAMTLRLE